MTAATGLLLTPIAHRIEHWWVITPPDDIGLTGPIDMPTPDASAEGRFSGELDAPATVDGLRVLAWLVAALAGTALCLWLLTIGAPLDVVLLFVVAGAALVATAVIW